MFCISTRIARTAFATSGRLLLGSLNNFKSIRFVHHLEETEKTISSSQMTSYIKQKTRYNGRIKKRKWEESQANVSAETGEPDSKKETTEPFERIKRKKVAMLLSYSGSNYHGMQRNPPMNTIEEELLKALLAVKYIEEDAFHHMQFIQYQRAARTDKGVSAVRQIVSLKMPNEVKVSEINQHLPPEIRVFSIKRVTKGFNSKGNCDARTYSYTMPTYTFDIHSNTIEEYKLFRISEDAVFKINNLLKEYLGTKNYHNFTSKKDFNDPSSKRYMIKIECEKPFVSEGLEFVTIKIKGQSFMLHQIRKMIGLIIAIMRGKAKDDTIERALSADQIDIPTAPGLGLVLEQVHYDRYDERYGKDGIHEPLVWDEIEEEINTFKSKYILSTIVSTEVKDMQMIEFLELLHKYTFEKREIARKYTFKVGGDDNNVDECEFDDEENECDSSQNIEEKIESKNI